jgi:uncharacterized protein DUF6011
MLVLKHSRKRLNKLKGKNMNNYTAVMDFGTGDVPTRGNAYELNFKDARGENKRVFVGKGAAVVEKGVFWVKNFILAPNQTGLRQALDYGWIPTIGAMKTIDKTVTTIAPQTATVEAIIKKGFFTVEREGERHRTFRVKTSRNNKTVIGLMVGRNNLKDYAWFGTIEGNTIRFWKNANMGFDMPPVQLPIEQDEINACFAAITSDTEEAGLRFAREYKNCSRCGKVLTTPESLDRGLGAECAGMRYGAAKK